MITVQSGYGRKTVQEDSKGGKPLAYWGIFSSSETDALRKCPNKLRLFFKSQLGTLRLNSDSSNTRYNEYSGCSVPTGLDSLTDILLHTLQLM